MKSQKESPASDEESKQQQKQLPEPPVTPDSGSKSKKEWKFIGFDKNQSAPYAKPIEGHVKTRKQHTKRGQEFTTYRFHLEKKESKSKPERLHLLNSNSSSSNSNSSSNQSNSPSASPVLHQIDAASSYPESTVQTPSIIHSLDIQIPLDFSLDLLPNEQEEDTGEKESPE